METLIDEQLVRPAHSRRRGTPGLDGERLRALITDGYRPARGRPAEASGRLITRAWRPFHDPLSDREVRAGALPGESSAGAPRAGAMADAPGRGAASGPR